MDKTEIMALADRIAATDAYTAKDFCNWRTPRMYRCDKPDSDEDVPVILIAAEYRDLIANALRLAAGASAGAFDFRAHLQRQREWSERTFGPGPRTKGVCDHIRNELTEIEAAPDDVEEWIDVAILALDGAWRTGASPETIIVRIVGKQTKNEARNWPDWRTADPDKAIEHVRDAALTPEPVKAGDEVMREALTLSQSVLSRAFNRIHCLPRTSDTELATMIEERIGANRAALSTTAPQPDNGARGAPGHTDLMVSPESIDAFMEKNPLPTGANQPDPRLATVIGGGTEWCGHHVLKSLCPQCSPHPSDTAPAEPVAQPVHPIKMPEYRYQELDTRGGNLTYGTVLRPVLVPDPNSASGQRVEYHPPRSVDVEAVSDRQTFERILASLHYDGADLNSLTVAEIRRAL
jgi:hypothetical protein